MVQEGLSLSIGDLWSEDVGHSEVLGKRIEAIQWFREEEPEGWDTGKEAAWCAAQEASVGGTEGAGTGLVRR